VGSCGTYLISGVNSASQNSLITTTAQPPLPYYINNVTNNFNATTINANNLNTIINPMAAVQFYTEQVRQEMTDIQNINYNEINRLGEQDKCQEYATALHDINQSINAMKIEETNINSISNNNNSSSNSNNNNNNMSSSLVNLHLGSINEIDAGNEADTEENDANEEK
jgi:hypothetical protein